MAKKKEAKEEAKKVYRVIAEKTHRQEFLILAASEDEATRKVELHFDELTPCENEGDQINIESCDDEYEINT